MQQGIITCTPENSQSLQQLMVVHFVRATTQIRSIQAAAPYAGCGKLKRVAIQDIAKAQMLPLYPNIYRVLGMTATSQSLIHFASHVMTCTWS